MRLIATCLVQVHILNVLYINIQSKQNRTEHTSLFRLKNIYRHRHAYAIKACVSMKYKTYIISKKDQFKKECNTRGFSEQVTWMM